MDEIYVAIESGFTLKVRRTDEGWEPSVIGPSTAATPADAQSLAERWAIAISGREIRTDWRKVTS